MARGKGEGRLAVVAYFEVTRANPIYTDVSLQSAVGVCSKRSIARPSKDAPRQKHRRWLKFP